MAGISEKLEGYSARAASRIGYARLLVWKDLLFHPDETLAREMGNASLGRAAKDLFVASYAFFLADSIYIGFVFGAVALFFLMAGGAGGMQVSGSVLTLVAAIAGAVLALVLGSALLAALSVASNFIWAGIEFALARMLGGKGEYAQHAYLGALAMSAYYVVSMPMMLLSMIPCLGYAFSMISIAIAAYLLYVRYKAIRLVHGIGQMEAVFVTVAPSAVLVLLFVALYVLVFLGFFTAGLWL